MLPSKQIYKTNALLAIYVPKIKYENTNYFIINTSSSKTDLHTTINSRILMHAQLLVKNKQRDRDREDHKIDIEIFSLYEENSTIQGMKTNLGKEKKNRTSPDT